MLNRRELKAITPISRETIVSLMSLLINEYLYEDFHKDLPPHHFYQMLVKDIKKLEKVFIEELAFHDYDIDKPDYYYESVKKALREKKKY